MAFNLLSLATLTNSSYSSFSASIALLVSRFREFGDGEDA